MFGRILSALVLSATATQLPELNDQTYARWRDHIHPTQAELGWQEVPWRSTFWEAVVEAQQKEMPILLWAMNGHPLACT
ncbi:MAG: hypothetical protein L0Z62_41440 [Gemmataceae bacterium]|nr:hypothetical protein [Gemmataceae bacterium]